MQKGNGVYGGGLGRFAMGSSSFYGLPPAMRISPNALMARYQAEAVYTGETSQFSYAAIPNGYQPPSSWQLSIKDGGMATYSTIVGVGTAAASMLAVKLAEAGLTGSGDLTAIGGLIVQLLADLVGSGEISDADMKAFLNMVASISGSGEISDAQITGLGALVAALLGDGTAADSILTGNGAMAADLVVTGTGLTTANVGQAVWSAIAASNNEPSTMGEKLNDAGSAGNPWATLLTGNNTPGTFGHYVQTTLDVKVDGIKKNTDIIPALL